MTIDEAKEKLRELGIDPDKAQWIESDGVTFIPEAATKAQEALIKVRDLLQAQVDQDLELLAQLQEEENRQKFGGGE